MCDRLALIEILPAVPLVVTEALATETDLLMTVEVTLVSTGGGTAGGEGCAYVARG